MDSLFDLDSRLYNAGESVRSTLQQTIVRIFALDITDDDMLIQRLWATAFGTLAYDISGSVLFLLLQGHRRAPMMLNRSLYEYKIRLRYYDSDIAKARQAMGQMMKQFRRIHAAHPDAVDHASLGMTPVELEQWLNHPEKFTKSTFKEILKEVVGEQELTRAYDGYYANVSAWVHGDETIIPEVHPINAFNERTSIAKIEIDWKGSIFKPNKQAVHAIASIADIIETIERRFGGGTVHTIRADMKALAQAMYAQGINLWN